MMDNLRRKVALKLCRVHKGMSSKYLSTADKGRGRTKSYSHYARRGPPTAQYTTQKR